MSTIEREYDLAAIRSRAQVGLAILNILIGAFRFLADRLVKLVARLGTGCNKASSSV